MLKSEYESNSGLRKRQCENIRRESTRDFSARQRRKFVAFQGRAEISFAAV